MKIILVAIDFSKNAEHALEYAAMYAKKINASLNLVWIDNNLTNDAILSTIEGDLRIEKKNYLKNLKLRYSEKLPGKDINIILGKGKVYQEIAKTAKKINADLIFAGTHGVSGYEQHWIGSNAYRIVTQAPCPVITIRSSYIITEHINNILLPLDNSLETKQKLPFIAELAELFNAKVNLLKVYNSPISIIKKRIDKFGEEAITCLKEKNIDYKIDCISVKNVAASILNYSNENMIDLIAIMTDQGTTTANKFLGPYSQQLINNSVIPIISVRAKEL